MESDGTVPSEQDREESNVKGHRDKVILILFFILGAIGLLFITVGSFMVLETNIDELSSSEVSLVEGESSQDWRSDQRRAGDTGTELEVD